VTKSVGRLATDLGVSVKDRHGSVLVSSPQAMLAGDV